VTCLGLRALRALVHWLLEALDNERCDLEPRASFSALGDGRMVGPSKGALAGERMLREIDVLERLEGFEI
jgi:hypothetical protein